jgi:hypothetical protein
MRAGHDASGSGQGARASGEAVAPRMIKDDHDVAGTGGRQYMTAAGGEADRAGHQLMNMTKEQHEVMASTHASAAKKVPRNSAAYTHHRTLSFYHSEMSKASK